MFKRALVFFPGFLGLESDWNSLLSLFPENFRQETQCIFMDYFSKRSELSPLNTWKELNEYTINKLEAKNIHFVGYSMGGRLALKLNQERGTPVSSVHLLSSHPGISKFHYPGDDVDGLKLERKNWDNIWADRFSRGSSFEDALKGWSQLDIFKNDQLINREASDYNNDKLALAFKRWSPAQIIIPNENLRGHHWVCGLKDQKYTELYKNMEKSLNGSFSYLKDVGHRTLFYPKYWASALIEKVEASES